MRHTVSRSLLVVATSLMAAVLSAQAPQDGGQPGRGGRGAGGFTSEPANPAVLLFREEWSRPMAQPMVQASIGNPRLVLHIYGNPSEIRKTAHPTEDYTYTGETTSNWAITLSDPKAL